MTIADFTKTKIASLTDVFIRKAESYKGYLSLLSSPMSSRRVRSYRLDPPLCLRPTPSGRDFSSLVEASRHDALTVAKIWSSQSEWDGLIKTVNRILEVHSFMEWTLGVIGKRVDLAVAEHSSDSNLENISDHLGVLDRAVADSLGELAVLFGNLTLKKRELFVGFLSKKFVDSQKAALLYGPVSKESLFRKDLIEDLASDLLVKDTHDAVAVSARARKPEAQKKKQAPSSSGRAPFFRPSTSRNFRRSGGARRKKNAGPTSQKSTASGK